MRKLNFPEEFINTISTIYNFEKMKIDLYQHAINVNRGVLQVSILSTVLFNIFINDLISKIDNVAFEVELWEVMNIKEDWANNNDVKIKKKGNFNIKRI